MQNLLHRLYTTRLMLLAVLLTAVGLALMLLAHWAADLPDWSWLNHVPVSDIGSGLFTTGLLAVAWQYFTGEVADEHTMQLFRHVLAEEAPDIRDAVIQGFAFTPDDLSRVASPATIDQIVRNTLALRLGNKELAADVYDDLRQQVVQSPEWQYNCSITVDLTPWQPPAGMQTPAMFVATVHSEYKVAPTRHIMRFSSTSDQSTYEELRRDPSSVWAWYFKPIGDLHGDLDKAFTLVQFTVDGNELPIHRSQQDRSQTYEVSLPQKLRKDRDASTASSESQLTIAYTYQVLVRQAGHVLYLDVGTPTRGWKVALRYGNCGIRDVTPLNFIASAEPSRVMQTPPSVPTPSVEIGFDGWVIPRSGVVFAWTLDSESTTISHS